MDTAVAQMMVKNPRRKPKWKYSRIEYIDAVALKEGKRCIMWDDSGNGFYLVCHTPSLTNIFRLHVLRIIFSSSAADELGLVEK